MKNGDKDKCKRRRKGGTWPRRDGEGLAIRGQIWAQSGWYPGRHWLSSTLERHGLNKGTYGMLRMTGKRCLAKQHVLWLRESRRQKVEGTSAHTSLEVVFFPNPKPSPLSAVTPGSHSSQEQHCFTTTSPTPWGWNFKLCNNHLLRKAFHNWVNGTVKGHLYVWPPRASIHWLCIKPWIRDRRDVPLTGTPGH